MNKFTITGRWIKDVELKGTNSAVMKGTLAVKRKFKKEGEPDADFFRITAFGKAAELITEYAGTKGTNILLSGHVQTGQYEKDGVKHNTWDVLVDEFEFLEKKPKAEPSFESQVTYEDGEIPF